MTSNGPLVSIVMPSYNQAQFLEEAILSVLHQDYLNIELVVIDGGLTDGSVDILRRYASRLAHWESKPDAGCASAINRGLAVSGGELVGVCASDDALCPGAVSRKVETFQRWPDVGFVFGDVDQIDGEGRVLFVRYGNDLPFCEWVRTCTMPVGQHSSLWRRSVGEAVGEWRTCMGVAGDWDFFLRVGLRCRMMYLPGVAGRFRSQPDSMSARKALAWTSLVPKMYADFFSREDLPAALQRVKSEALASAQLLRASLFIEHGFFAQALKSAVRALRMYPGLLFTKRFGRLLTERVGQRTVSWVCGGGQSAIYKQARRFYRIMAKRHLAE